MPPKKTTVSFTTADGRNVSFQRDPNKPKKEKEQKPDSWSHPNPDQPQEEGAQTKRPTDLRPVLVLQDERPHQLSQHAGQANPAKRP